MEIQMPERIPRRVQQYLNTARRFGPEMILETAEEDEDLTDPEWELLWTKMQTWTRDWAWGKEDGKGPVKWYKKKAPKPVLCEGCGKPIPPDQMQEGGRKRKYHDNGNVCKQLAYRKRRQKARA